MNAKTLLATAAAVVATVLLPAQAAKLEIQVEGLAKSEGLVMVAVYDSAESWMKKMVRGAVVKPQTDGSALLVIDDLPDGDYAISLLHDLNGNSKMDFNVLGIPTEPFAFSNNAAGSFGPPKFDEARFSLKGNAVQRIKF